MRTTLLAVLVLVTFQATAQLFHKPVYSGIYFQWGYNRDKYSRSDLHLSKEGTYNITLHDAKATDQPNFKEFFKSPVDITIPQNSCRLGVYLNAAHTHAIELNFDHAKYVVTDSQRLHMTGELYGSALDVNRVIEHNYIHVEHTNGANFLMLNYVGQHEILSNKKRLLATVIWKGGGGIVIPKSYVIFMGRKLDNELHVAGCIFGAEGGLRFHVLKHLFMEATAKGGYADYFNALTVDGGKLSHHFFFGEIIGTAGYDLNFWAKKPKPVTKPATD